MLRAFQFILVLLMLAMLAMLSAIATMHFAIHGAEVIVPNLRGLTSAEAAGKAAQLGLNIGVADHLYSIDIPAGHIITQSPVPGAIVRNGWHVRIIESLGPQHVVIPNLMGLDQRAASIQLRRNALEIGSSATMSWAYAPEGTVIAQNPTPGAAGIARPSVNLFFAAPPVESSPAFLMPNLLGQQFSAAAQIIARAGLKLAPAIEQSVQVTAIANRSAAAPIPPVAPAGSIVAQSPQPGQRVDASTPIEFTVAK
ncbi:MAG TPA: PASTA domain-containing protein [Silvibacterium sp.]|nr:PASTA domain-containing protein [Silvibacterium sp.]